MKQNGVDVSRVRKVSGQSTGVGVVIVETKDETHRILLCPGANYDLKRKEFETLESLDVLNGGKPDLLISQMELRRETVEQISKTAKAHGVDTLLNPAPAHALTESAYKMITHLVVNETEAAKFKTETEGERSSVTDDFIKRGELNVFITFGD